ncbi:hypothetical protein C8J57DRAFT_1367531 [Mycena rebaudengoi]|nr:hypothetical protein C8J57DRAFT_1367531 [Mycena rebaudengoi]
MISIGGEIFTMYSIFCASPQIALGGVGGKGGSGGQEGGDGGRAEGPRFECIKMNIQQCYFNTGPSDLMNLPSRDPLRAVRMHSTTPNDTTDGPADAFLELKDYEITIVLRPVSLALQTEIPNPKSFPKEPTAHELVAWKVRMLMVIWSILSTGKDGTIIHLPTHLGFGDVNDNQGILGNGSFCLAPPGTLVTWTSMGSWRSANIDPRLGKLVLATNEACCPVDFALGTYHTKRNGTEDYFSPLLVIRNVLNGNFCIAPQCKDFMVNAYITQNMRERQIFPGLCDISNGLDFREDRTPKIISAPLLGKNGRLVSNLAQKTRWLLVNKSRNLELKIVDE